MEHGLKAERFFSAEERRRIREATQDAESRTIGEVAVMVVESSDHYFDAEILGGVLLSSILALVLSEIYFHSSLWWYISLSFVIFFPGKLVFKKAPGLKTHFVSPHRKEHAVRIRAIRAFYEKGLYKTRKNTGVLFFISLFEKKVRVLADSGIHEKIGQETLDKFAKMVSHGIKDGRAADSLCEAIKEAGELLAGHFPITPGDTNELCDDVMAE